MIEKSHEIDHLFKCETISFLKKVEDKDGKKVHKNVYHHVVTTSDVSKLIDEVVMLRKLNPEDVLLRIGLDGGGGFLKVCLSIFELLTNSNPSSPSTSSSSSKKPLPNKFKDSGVKKVIILGIAPGVEELYSNVKKLWVSIGLHTIQRPFTIATDLKLCNILLALMSHSSMHPCCWCDIDKNNLEKKGSQRTLESLTNLFWDFFESHSSKDNAKDYGNVIHLPIFDNVDPSTPVINVVSPPELHLMLGPVNHISDHMEKVWQNSDDWLKSCHVKKSDYHGGAFEGNECRKLLKNVEKLKQMCPEECFVDAFASFNEVVSACYSSDLHHEYKVKIENFKKAFMKLNISVTPKVHAVFFHVEEFCSLKGKGLGPWSEQTSESLHHEFTTCWENYKVKDEDHPLYGERLLAAVQMFNNLNL